MIPQDKKLVNYKLLKGKFRQFSFFEKIILLSFSYRIQLKNLMR